jgi:hypothetical protein
MQSVIEAATRRVMESYALMRDDDAAEAVRAKIVSFIEQAWRAGETDDNRLAVSALIFLRTSDHGRATNAGLARGPD